MNTLVLGGAGFIGASLCRRLLAEGCHVTVVDSLHTGLRENLADLDDAQGFNFIEHDIVNPLHGVVGGGFQRIYNLACPASPPHYQADPIRTARTCFVGTLNALEFAEAEGARLLQASTSEIYGDPDVHPQPESYRGLVNPLGPRACYDEGKRIGETLCSDFRRTKNVESRIARIFNTYGPFMRGDDGRVVTNFIAQSLAGEPLTIFGSGEQTRSFCFVDDLVEGLWRLMEHEGALDEPVNLGNPDERTIVEVARTIAEMTGSKGDIVFRPLPADDPRQRCPDITRAQELLSWTPTVDFETGLAKTISWFGS